MCGLSDLFPSMEHFAGERNFELLFICALTQGQFTFITFYILLFIPLVSLEKITHILPIDTELYIILFFNMYKIHLKICLQTQILILSLREMTILEFKC